MKLNEEVRRTVLAKEFPWAIPYVYPHTEELKIIPFTESALNLQTFGLLSEFTGAFTPFGQILLFDEAGEVIDTVGGWKEKVIDQLRFTWKYPPLRRVKSIRRIGVRESVQETFFRLGSQAAATAFIVDRRLIQALGKRLPPSLDIYVFPKDTPNYGEWIKKKDEEEIQVFARQLR